ncbi:MULTISPECIES: 4-hydroxy-tetrahydrodipicolinate reductase [Aerococcus]|uniref:4-hydroxy-tetrahydrodipicolinate reductase n=2 Tax=Aerococcus TaxID=1375 RepID=A0A9Q4DCN8_9LACT|nr:MULTISPECIES: 4-hydroxy-tetrahydrodipicolinate reductase [Aerococcus]MCY3035077.1 4-hydroxy-tetrahydrodipicolinate reductase [Aerococcus mictus]MCY3063316.1 4-hydroxy-tetrahydrodipicolinate reductase [Aerococcus mictus]MCY3065851.1 4-hydroxy-tetrahydrodipicolinate reductase [Aerococcus mictus]MCY3066368.1 4-hydroxy-tetrahydrodipicolinate reductase [Aerococcus mictus]MCY3068681.1 4-hydroxy-tetrahydrodipicolinate reductase [Aerococcus mictus]
MKMKVMVTGFLGKMGQTTVNMINESDDFTLAALVNHHLDQHQDDLETFKGLAPIYSSVEEALGEVEVDAVVDFTQPSVVFDHCKTYIEHNIHPVIGTSGLESDEISHLQALASEKKLGGVIAPNFAISSVLMQLFSQEAAKYLDHVEIIEMHHAQKADAPSGTAIKTADLIHESQKQKEDHVVNRNESIAGARGADYKGIPIHSVRLPGLNSHQIVQFGAPGEGLTIRQDSYNRESYMHGVALALKASDQLEEFVYGLEHIL